MKTDEFLEKIVDVCDEWQKEQKLARLLEEIGYDFELWRENLEESAHFQCYGTLVST